MSIVSLYKKSHFCKHFLFFYFQKESKLIPLFLHCTVPIYVLSMYKRTIKSVEGVTEIQAVHNKTQKRPHTDRGKMTDGRTGLNTIEACR